MKTRRIVIDTTIEELFAYDVMCMCEKYVKAYLSDVAFDIAKHIKSSQTCSTRVSRLGIREYGVDGNEFTLSRGNGFDYKKKLVIVSFQDGNEYRYQVWEVDNWNIK